MSALGIPFEFAIFATILMGVAVFHHRTLQIAVAGLTAVILYKLTFTGFKTGNGFDGLFSHFRHEWVQICNLFLLLVSFALLASHFEKSRIPDVLPRILPHDWKGGFYLLVIVFVLSAFLDNIAGALIGGAMANTLFRSRVHIGFLAAIVAASNAGGTGSVLGDTTTTMMWISGISPLEVLPAYKGALIALIAFGIPAAFQQQRYSPILKQQEHQSIDIDWGCIVIVGSMLVTAILTNIILNVFHPGPADRFPFIGVATVAVLLLGAFFRRPNWKLVPAAAKGSVFLLSLVFTATLMPVGNLPEPSWQTALGLGFLSAVFDNIPLTTLALKQGGYDWGILAYAVGFGGSMIWFGSSAGVALSNLFPEAKSARLWLKHGWHVALAYVLGFAALLAFSN